VNNWLIFDGELLKVCDFFVPNDALPGYATSLIKYFMHYNA